MDSRWLTAWSDFVRSETIEGEEIKGDEAQPPGPVSSKFLLKEDRMTPLDNLEVRFDILISKRLIIHTIASRLDYRAVTPLVYYSFVELYGKDDSPEICRYVVDIYKAEVRLNRTRIRSLTCPGAVG